LYSSKNSSLYEDETTSNQLDSSSSFIIFFFGLELDFDFDLDLFSFEGLFSLVGVFSRAEAVVFFFLP
jgi:hypothetical protein